MSGIYGIFRCDGAPVDPADLARMRSAMAYYGPDGGGAWQDGPVGLGQLQLNVTPEDRYEVQPLSKDGVTLVAAARLDNRDELLRAFRVPSPDHPATPDSALVLDAYLTWGEECPDHLDGDWQFAAWDGRSRKLFIARDHHGITDICFCRSQHLVAFASSLRALLALESTPPGLDMLRVAQELTGWKESPFRTHYEKIARLPAAHTLTAGENRFLTRRYWFPENLPILSRARDEEYVEEFTALYEQAVRTRLRSLKPVGIALSGGLDSGSVATLAAPILAAAGERLTAFTAVPRFDPVGAGDDRTGDEWQLAAAVAGQAGNVDHFPLRCDDDGVLAGIRRELEIQGEPVSAAGNAYWIHALLTLAGQRGVGTLLTGQYGNATVSFQGSGDYLTPLRQGEFRSAWRSFFHAESSAWLTVKRQVLKPLLMPVVRWYRCSSRMGLEPWQQFSGMRPEFARRMRLAEHLRAASFSPSALPLPGRALQLATLCPGGDTGNHLWYHTGAAFGMDIRDPTCDRKMVEFCLRIPDHQYRRHGESAWLLRRAMAGRMPREVLFNRKRGLQSADLGFRILRERAGFAAALEALDHSELAGSVLDITALREALPVLESEVTVATFSQSRDLLLGGLEVGLFLAAAHPGRAGRCS